LNSDFNKFKVDDSINVNMLIQEMWKKLLNCSSIIAKYWVACVLVYYNKCKVQFVSSGFNILKVNGSTHVHMLIIIEMWKKITNSFQYKCGVLNCYMCFNKL